MVDLGTITCGSDGKECACNVGDLGLVPGLGRSPGEGKGYPLQYSSLENFMDYTVHVGFSCGSEVKVSACNAEDQGSIPGLGRSPGEGNGNPLQYSCLENPMNGGAWWATVHRVAESRLHFHFLSYRYHYCSKVKVAQSYLALCNPWTV